MMGLARSLAAARGMRVSRNHDLCVHRRGWRIVLHADGTMSVYGPRGQTLHSHAPPMPHMELSRPGVA